MTTNETSFSLLESNIAEDVEVYAQLKKYQKCGKLPKKTIDPSVCVSTIELTDNQPFDDGYSNQMTKEMERYHLKDIFQPMWSRLCE